MGYHTEFSGALEFNRPLDKTMHKFLTQFNQTRRMGRKGLDAKYGTEGEFYVKDDSLGVIDQNRPPKTQPGLWCQWIPTDDGTCLEWDGGEKFYNYVEWLEYLINKVLAPKDYILNGEISWTGENSDDHGTIIVTDNYVEAVSTAEQVGALELILQQKKLLPMLLGLSPYLDRQIAKRMKE